MNFKFLNRYTVAVHQFQSQHVESLDTTLILLPAIGVSIAKYHELIEALSHLGFVVIAADYPCCGENTPHVDRSVDYNYSDLVNDFIVKLVALSKTKQTVLLGHSLGAHLASLYATQHNISVIGIATGNIHYKNWQGVGQLNIFAVAVLFKMMVKIYGYFPGYKIGFGYKETRGIMEDWCHTAFTGNYDYFSKKLTKAQAKSYFMQVKGDEYAPLESIRGLAELFQDKCVEQI